MNREITRHLHTSTVTLRKIFLPLASNGGLSLHCEERRAVRSLTFDQSCLAPFQSCFEVVSLKMAGVTKIRSVVEG